jgi:tetratricopeptide (TPR) repeat protein
VEQGLLEGSERFLRDYEGQDAELVLAIALEPKFGQTESVRQALLEIIEHPGVDLATERTILTQGFSALFDPPVDDKRIDQAVRFYLRCIAESLWHLEPFRSKYELQMGKLGLEQGAATVQELQGMRDELRDIKSVFLEAMGEQRRLLAASERQALPEPSTAHSQRPEAEMADSETILTKNLRRLRRNLVNAFTDDELKTLSFDLGVDYGVLSGGNKEAMARELILYLYRRGRIRDLIEECSQRRPHLVWETEPKMPQDGIAATVSHPPTSLEIRMAIDRINSYVGKVKELMGKSKYPEAVRYAGDHRELLSTFSKQDDLRFVLTFAEFDVWYAHARMYVGETLEAMNELEDVILRLEGMEPRYRGHDLQSRWHIILGRAHNHVGYINWMDLGHYEFALAKFLTAIRHCNAAKRLTGRPNDELATAYDNMGRVYAELGYRVRAELLIEHGRQTRESLPEITRRALSLNSRAIAHLAFGEPNHASILSAKALAGFEQYANPRGIGLALLTRGRALRYLAAHTYLKDNDPQGNREKLEEAEAHLGKALNIFQEVGEKVRLFQAYNELGCVRRERAYLERQQGKMDDAERAADAARDFLRESVGIARGNGSRTQPDYPIHYADACVDLAETYFMMNNRRQAQNWIKRAQEAVSDEYLLDTDLTYTKIPPADCAEDLWHQLGKAAALRGHIERNLFKAIEHYTLAAAYFGRFLSRPLAAENCALYPHYRPQLVHHRIFIEELHDRLKDLESNQLLDVKKEIEDLQHKYPIQASWIEDFCADTIEFLVQMNAQQG